MPGTILNILHLRLIKSYNNPMRYKYHSYVHFADEATKAWKDWLACPWSTQLVKGGEKIHLQICLMHSQSLLSQLPVATYLYQICGDP